MQDELLRSSMLVVHVFPYTHTTSLWVPGNWPISLRNCHVSMQDIQIYHIDRFAYGSHWCKTATQDSFVGSDIMHALPTHEPSQWSCVIERKWKIYQYAPLAYKVLTCNCPLSSKGQHKSTNVVDLHISQWRRTSFQWHKWTTPRRLCLWWQLNILKIIYHLPTLNSQNFQSHKTCVVGLIH
jgi:hypothetical protein